VTADLWLVPVVVELHQLDGDRARLLITWASGTRGKMDALVKEAQVILLEAIAAQGSGEYREVAGDEERHRVCNQGFSRG